MEKKMKQPNKLNKPKEPNNPKSEGEVFKKAFEDMCRGLDRFGPKEILNLMVIHSHRDDIVHHLLVQFPTVVAWSDFLHTLPVRKVNKRTFKRLQRSGCIV